MQPSGSKMRVNEFTELRRVRVGPGIGALNRFWGGISAAETLNLGKAQGSRRLARVGLTGQAPKTKGATVSRVHFEVVWLIRERCSRATDIAASRRPFEEIARSGTQFDGASFSTDERRLRPSATPRFSSNELNQARHTLPIYRRTSHELPIDTTTRSTMTAITLTDGLAIWELVYYIVALVGSIWVSCRHGLAKNSGWIFLAIFSTIRVISNCAQIATITAKSDTPETIATITGFLGLSPLLLATLGILSRVFYSILKAPWGLVFSLGAAKAVQIPAGIALILCIVGAVSANSPREIVEQGTVKAGVVLFFVVLILIALLVVGAAIGRHYTNRGEGRLLGVVAAALPVLLIRIIYSLILVFGDGPKGFTMDGSTFSVMAELLMERIEEMVVVLMFLWAGLNQEAVPRDDDGVERTKGEKIMYRFGRGDFSTGKLGMLSLAAHVISGMFKAQTSSPAPIAWLRARVWRLDSTYRRCDRVLPMCGQCCRKQILCPGYRDPSELRFRDETLRVAGMVQRAKKKRLPKLPKPSTSSSSSSSSSSSNREKPAKSCEPVVPPESEEDTSFLSLSLKVLTQTPEHIAITFFLKSFISATPFEWYLPELYNSKAITDDALSSAIQAASFATFATRVRDLSYMKTARHFYALALVRTNALLACPKAAVLDETLAAVLLLGQFEAIVFRGRQSPESWTTHTLGAVELLRLRGTKQFQSKIAHLLFLQTITNIRTSCIQRMVPVPAPCLALYHDALGYLDVKKPAVRMGPIMDQAASLRAQSAKISSIELFEEAWELDQQCLALLAGLAPEMCFIVRPKEDNPPWAYLDTAHRYPNHWVAKFWNALRMIRMFLNELIYDGAEKAVAEQHPPSNLPTLCGSLCKCEYLNGIQQTAADNMTNLATDVLASVPDFVEPHGHGGKFYPAARHLIWPLSIIQRSPLASDLAKKYTGTFLYELGRELNLPQAVDETTVREMTGIREDWLHLYHLG
ncbi:hypothetical protein G7046_g403 [Stylonectria norvegica]|nr:hypothetical protein G7046_g403 [Stylonectria norvegica]